MITHTRKRDAPDIVEADEPHKPLANGHPSFVLRVFYASMTLAEIPATMGVVLLLPLEAAEAWRRWRWSRREQRK